MAQQLLVEAALMAGLNFTVVGSGRPRFAFLHGLLGRGRNWSQIAQGLAEGGQASVLFDLPNHGTSPWTDDFSYQQMAETVATEIEERLGASGGLILAGHSMGGKVAMLAALARPDLLSALAVIDISPADSAPVGRFADFIAAMKSIELPRLRSRKDAEAELSATVADPMVRQFLLTNLHKKGGWHWQANLELLSASLSQVAGWPEIGESTFSGPVSWIVAERSDYHDPADLALMKGYFPALTKVVVPDAGHWVHADNPEAVIRALAELSAAAPS